MTGVLFDTEALLWLVSEPGRLCPEAGRILADLTVELHVSVASAREVAIKTRTGRLEGRPLLAAWVDTVAALGATEMVIESEDAILAGEFGWEHKDPFDRMLVAQATRRGLTLASSDRRILELTQVAVLDTRA